MTVEGSKDRADDQQYDQGNKVKRDDDRAFLHIGLPTFRTANTGIALVPGSDDLGARQRKEAGAGDSNDFGENLGRRQAIEDAHYPAIDVIHATYDPRRSRIHIRDQLTFHACDLILEHQLALFEALQLQLIGMDFHSVALDDFIEITMLDPQHTQQLKNTEQLA